MPRSQKILIAYDGSPAAEAVFNDLRRAGLEAKGQAKVVTIADMWVPPVDSMSGAAIGWYAGAFGSGRWDSDNFLKDAKTMADKGAAKLRQAFPEWKVSSTAQLDTPAAGILTLAEKWKPSLIALGTLGHSELGRVFLGSVSHKVLTHAVCNVRVVRPAPDRKAAPPPRILIGVDGSKDAEAALHAVARRTWPKGAEFRIVVVVDYRLSLTEEFHAENSPRFPLKGVPFRGRLGDRLAEQGVFALAERGLRVTSSVTEGDPRRELLREAKRFKADSIFLGSRGLHALQRFFLGSVSLNVAEHAPCTVEVVRR